MEELSLKQSEFIGREEELAKLKQSLNQAVKGKGSTILINGEAGIGKSRLVEEFRNNANDAGVRMLHGAASADMMQPFLLFSNALGECTDEPLFHEQEYNAFTAVFVVNRAGLLVGTASPEDEGLDADIFAGMLSAVQSFVHDSIDKNTEQATGLGRLEYGDMKISIEHGKYLFLTAVLKGQEHGEMRDTLKRALNGIEEEYGHILENWNGKIEDVEPVQKQIEKLVERRFLVKKNLDGINLENERLRIGDQVLKTLARLSTNEPCLVLLEDLHWADDSSLFVLNYIARNIRDMPILILATARPDDSERLRETVDKMVEEGLLAIEELKSLDENDITALVHKAYEPNDFPDNFFESLIKQCEGNPFFVIELMNQMQVEGNISLKEGQYVLVNENYSIPNTVEEVVGRKLRGLEPDAMAMSEYASCIGRVFERIIALSFESIKDTKLALDKLEDARILVELGKMDEFTHAIIHDIIYQGTSNRWKTVYHKSLGEFYEVAYKDRLDNVIYELARHFSRSNDHVRAYNYCIRAGEKAESTFAAEQAIHHYELALKSLPKAGLATLAEEKTLSHLETLGGLYAVIGKFDISLEHYKKVLDKTSDRSIIARTRIKRSKTFEKKGDFDSAMREAEIGREETEKDTADYWRVESARALALMRKGKYDDSIKLIEKTIEGLGKFEGTEVDIANGYNHIGGNCWYIGDFDRALDVFGKSLKIFESLGEKDRTGAIYNNTGLILRNIGENDKAMEYFLKGMEIFEKTGDRRRIVSASTNISTIYDDWGQKDRMLEYTDKALKLSTSIGDLYGMALCNGNLGLAYFQKVDMKKAMEHSKKCLNLYEKMGDGNGIAHGMDNLAAVELELGNIERARELGLEALKAREEMGDQQGLAMSQKLMGYIHRVTGDIEEAKEWLKKSIDTSKEINLVFYISEPMIMLAEILIAEDNIEEARILIEEAKKAWQESKIAVHGVLCSRAESLILQKEGNIEKAGKLFEDAISKFEKYDNIYESLMTKYKWASASGDREMLSEISNIFREKEMKLWEDKCLKVLAELEQ